MSRYQDKSYDKSDLRKLEEFQENCQQSFLLVGGDELLVNDIVCYCKRAKYRFRYLVL